MKNLLNRDFLKRLSFIACLLGFAVLLSGCSDLLSEKISSEYGSVSINSERAVFVDDIKSAKATICGYNSLGSKFEIKTGLAAVSGGLATFPAVENIPVSKNVVIEVQAYGDSSANAKIDGITLYSVCDIKSGPNSVSVNWESSKKGKVFAALFNKGENLSKLTDVQLSSINNAIPSGVHASLIDAESIAADFKAGSLKESTAYALTAGSVKITANGCSGCTVQVSDPNSKVSSVVAADYTEVTISDVAPGTWNVYAVKDGAVVKSGTVTVESSAAAEVVLGNVVVTDKIIVHVPESLNYNYCYAWSGAATTAKWPGDKMTEKSGSYYSFTLGCTATKIIFNNGSGGSAGNGQTSDLYIPSAGEYWYIGGASGTKDEDGSKLSSNFSTQNPNQPVPPSVTVPSKAYLGGSFTITVSSDSELIQNTISINGISKTLAVGSNSFNVSDFTKSVGTITVSGTVSNSAGSKTVSGMISIVEKPVNTLVTNFNELRIYQVMVSHFQDGDSSIGYTNAYGPSGQTYGGDLQGIINAIPYIKELGCNALWMTPIFNSNSSSSGDQMGSTGYYAYDFFDIDPRFGTKATFERLVEVCHENGINVILDGVFGHWGTSVKASPSGKTPSRSHGQYKGCDYPASLEFFKEVASYWITNYKIDGWRLDQAYQAGARDSDGEVYTGNKNYWPQLRETVEQAALSNGTLGKDWGTLGYMCGEVLDGNQPNIQNWVVVNDGLRSCFDFPSRYKLCQAIVGGSEWSNSSGTISYKDAMEYTYGTYQEKGYAHSGGYYPNLFFANHDLFRFGDLIINWKKDSYGSSNYVGRYKVALATLAAYTGPITIYYGDEWGEATQGISLVAANNISVGKGAYWDNASRTSGRIDKAINGTTAEKEVLQYSKKLLNVRSEHEALWNGIVSPISTSSSSLYVAKKTSDSETIYVAINNGESSATFSLSENGFDLLSDSDISKGTVTVPALSARFILVK